MLIKYHFVYYGLDNPFLLVISFIKAQNNTRPNVY